MRATDNITPSVAPSPASPAKKMKQGQPTISAKSAAKSTKSATSPSSDRTAKNSPRAVCMCAPTNHPGSFRCRFHRARAISSQKVASYEPKATGRSDCRDRVARTPRLSRLSAVSMQAA
ncbi:unnamed protein product [Closterium sp. Yama58-4]|nr:unnamed protein product [Closterium sp. Yama58-4]